MSYMQNRSDQVEDIFEATTLSSKFQIVPSMYAFWSVRQVLRNGEIQFCTATMLPSDFRKQVKPVCPDYPTNLIGVNFLPSKHAPIFLAKLTC
jgi:hypothetical protein